MKTPFEFAKRYIGRWEGVYSGDAADNGNWTGGKRGAGQLVGSQYGVTPAAIAGHRKIPVASVTIATIKSITLDEAAQIALSAYYLKPRLDLLPWNAVTASIMDFGWGAGPVQAIKLLQRMLDTADDGIMGPATAGAYQGLLAAQGEVFVAGAWWTIRDSFYELIIGKNPSNAKFEKGWDNRSRYFTPGDAEGWWAWFHA
ncbi:MAG: glycosyl hydrolase 108 family protein [Pseudomonadota bacterium]